MRMNEVPLWAWISVVCKFAESTTVRSLYPYVSSLADMLGVSPEAVALCISLKEVGYAAMPVFGPYLTACAGAGGPVSVRVGAGLALAACSLLIGAVNSFAVFAVAVLLIGAVKSLAEVGTQMMVTAFTARDDRGRTVAVIELAWGLSSLVGVPLFGLLMSVAWAWAWVVFAAVGTLSCALLHFLRPNADGATPAGHGDVRSRVDTVVQQEGQLRRYCRLLGTAEGRAVAIGGVLLCAVADALFISFGVWLEEVHQLDLTSIALASVSIGVADMAAELLLTYTMHVYSPPVSLSVGWLIQLVSYAALPWLTTAESGVAFSVCVFAVQVFTFEFAVVSLMGSTSYLDSRACGVEDGDMESLQFVAFGTGRIVGAPLGLKLLEVGRAAGGQTSLLLGVSILGVGASAVGLTLAVLAARSSAARVSKRGDASSVDSISENAAPAEARLGTAAPPPHKRPRAAAEPDNP